MSNAMTLLTSGGCCSVGCCGASRAVGVHQSTLGAPCAALPIVDPPTSALCPARRGRVGFQGVGMAAQLEPHQVGVAVAVAVRAAQVEAVLGGVLRQPRGPG